MNLARVEAARTFIGVKFQHQGRTVHGLDCAGLLWLAERACGRDPPDVKGYSRHPWKDGLRAAVEGYFGPPVQRDLEPGDVLLMKHSRRDEPEHLAIVGIHPSGGLSIIHAYAGNSARKVVETILDAPWRAKILAVYA